MRRSSFEHYNNSYFGSKEAAKEMFIFAAYWNTIYGSDARWFQEEDVVASGQAG